ncbi:MAG: hypothetical protein COB97_02635 [Paracoccus sp.]|nr:MAG: hypothetical protein COB97_02635 [Paracoccus sp. (in: a-proteobacteria)]
MGAQGRSREFCRLIRCFVVCMLSSIALLRRDLLLEEFLRIGRSHYGSRQIKPRAQGLVSFFFESRKPSFRLAAEAFN